MRKAIIATVAIALATPAVAGCPYGQILRVSMGKCVSWHSKLAQGYVHVARHRRIVVAAQQIKSLSTTIQDKGGTEPPEIEMLREQLAAPARLKPIDILLSRAAALAP